eukprot:3942498-Alexandrium_andersonii.AAC.1
MKRARSRDMNCTSGVRGTSSSAAGVQGHEGAPEVLGHEAHADGVRGHEDALGREAALGQEAGERGVQGHEQDRRP